VIAKYPGSMTEDNRLLIQIRFIAIHHCPLMLLLLHLKLGCKIPSAVSNMFTMV